MKTTEFIVENEMIAQEAHDMHKDHEVQMARSQMYSAAEAAIEIHKMLKDISELEGLEGWVQSKLTLASEYLESVRDYLKYEAASQQTEMMPFAEGAANYAVDRLLAEGDWKEYAAKNPDKFSQASQDFYARNTHRMSGDEGLPGSTSEKRRTGPTVDRAGQPITGLATIVSKPEGVPKVAKKPITSFGGGGGAGGRMDLADPSAVKSLIPNFESAEGHDAPKQRQWNDDDFYAYDPETNTIKDHWGYKSTGRLHHERAAHEKGWKVVRGMSAKFMDLKEGKRPVSEMTSGSTGSSGMAIVMTGGGNHKPGTGKPKKIGNTASMKKVQVGKGIY